MIENIFSHSEKSRFSGNGIVPNARECGHVIGGIAPRGGGKMADRPEEKAQGKPADLETLNEVGQGKLSSCAAFQSGGTLPRNNEFLSTHSNIA
jgi:hypothetical protein